MTDSNSVALAAIAALATCIGAMVWVVKKVLSDIAPALTNHKEAADGLKDAVSKNTEVSEEMIIFMRKLNGKLPKLVADKKKQARKE
jgi:hypothetical protein